jgi:6-phosphogluconolactonase
MKPTPDGLVYIGTYSDAIYCCSLPGVPRIAAQLPKPSFLALHPNRHYLYVASEQSEGLVSAWRIESTSGILSFVNQTTSGGAGPCHIALDASGAIAVVCNYADGSINAVRIRPDGSLGETLAAYRNSGTGLRQPRQSAPHPHGAFFSPDNRLVVVPDLGLDKLFLYGVSDTLNPGGPPSVDLLPGSGPRHFVFHPEGRYGYAICELTSTIATFHCNGTSLETVATRSALPRQHKGKNIAAGILIDPAGRFLYCSNRGADTIGVFAIGANGDLETVQHVSSEGAAPRHIAMDGTGEWLLAANQDADSVVVFCRDSESGRLTANPPKIGVPRPTCIVFC